MPRAMTLETLRARKIARLAGPANRSLIVGVAVLLLAAACQVQPGGRREHLVEVDMTTEQWAFDPAVLRVRQGDTVVLRIESLDIVHGFGLPEFGVGRSTPPGRVTTIRFVADRPGTYTYFCTVFCGTGHPGHRGRLIVEPAP